MVNKEILGGLKIALEKGESLKRAMNTMFNAGYKKEEIEEAARALSEPLGEKGERALNLAIPEPNKKTPSPPKTQFFKKLFAPHEKPIKKLPVAQEKKEPPKSSPAPKPITPLPAKAPPAPANQNFAPQTLQPVIIQKVSAYDDNQTTKEKVIIAVLITILMILFGALAAIFLFQQQLINFFSNIFTQST